MQSIRSFYNQKLSASQSSSKLMKQSINNNRSHSFALYSWKNKNKTQWFIMRYAQAQLTPKRWSTSPSTLYRKKVQSINQLFNQKSFNNRLINFNRYNQSFIESIMNHQVREWMNEWMNELTNESINQSINQPTNQPNNQQSRNQLINQSHNHSLTQSINQSQSIDF